MEQVQEIKTILLMVQHGGRIIGASYAIIKLAEPKYVSTLSYTGVTKTALMDGIIPQSYGIAKNIEIYTSMDNENWTLAKTQTLSNNTGEQLIKLDTNKIRKGSIC